MHPLWFTSKNPGSAFKVQPLRQYSVAIVDSAISRAVVQEELEIVSHAKLKLQACRRIRMTETLFIIFV